MSTPDAAAKPSPVEGLYAFVRGHLTPANQVVAASCTLVAFIDFMSPRLSMAPRIVYSMTAAVLALMLVAGVAPRLVGGLISAVGFGAGDGAVPLWRRPGWQFAIAMLIGVTVLGWASVAKASQGGLIASQFPSVRALQDRLLSIDMGVAKANAGIEAANGKLDRIAGAVDPDNAADKCADVECAVMQGADAAYLRRLFAKGAALPADAPSQAALLQRAMSSDRPDRLDVVDALLAHGVDPSLPMPFARAESAGDVTPAGAALAAEVLRLAPSDEDSNRFLAIADAPGAKPWNQAWRCLGATSGAVYPLEFAAARGDAELYAHLAAKGSRLPSRPLLCASRAGGARVVIEDGRASANPAPARPAARRLDGLARRATNQPS